MKLASIASHTAIPLSANHPTWQLCDTKAVPGK